MNEDPFPWYGKDLVLSKPTKNSLVLQFTTNTLYIYPLQFYSIPYR
jgi:hypothetical protein